MDAAAKARGLLSKRPDKPENGLDGDDEGATSRGLKANLRAGAATSWNPPTMLARPKADAGNPTNVRLRCCSMVKRWILSDLPRSLMWTFSKLLRQIKAK
jgi:hypothetical protein